MPFLPPATERILEEGGGLDPLEGAPRDARRLWGSLEGAQSILILAADRRTVVGEVRIFPDGAGLCRVDDEYSLLSPEELEELAHARELALGNPEG
jgi:hypothetical protein